MDEIAEIIRLGRIKKGLNKSELARKVGVSSTAVASWENGKKVPVADTFLKVLRELDLLPELSSRVIKASQESIDQYIDSAANRLKLGKKNDDLIPTVKADHFEGDEWTGYQIPNEDKLYDMMLVFCEDGESRTRLNKLLFYADFKHCKECGKSISGTRYARINFGPAPHEFKRHFDFLIEMGVLGTKMEKANGDFGVEKLFALDYKFSLSDEELTTIALIKHKFKDFSSKEITAFSHEEKGYVDTENGRLISYVYTNDLKI